MPNDPSEVVVDWSKLPPQPSKEQPNSDNPLITMCTEGKSLIGLETASKDYLRGFEIFTKNDED